MPEMKICPVCGKEILAVAKKCKYCKSWIEPKEEFRCPICREVIPADSVICPVCHERLRPDPEIHSLEIPLEEPSAAKAPVIEAIPVSEPVQDDPEEESQPGPVVEDIYHATEKSSSRRKMWIIAPVFAGIALLVAAAILLFGKGSGGNACYKDARALHEWFFENVGARVISLDDCPELQTRLTKLVGGKTVKKLEEMLSESADENWPNIGLTFEKGVGDVYLFSGTKNSTVNPETFAIRYIDRGESGYFDVITLLDGKRKAAKEPVKAKGEPEQIVRLYEYDGHIGFAKNGYKADFILYIDGPGEPGDRVRGYYSSGVASMKPMVEGIVPEYGDFFSLHTEDGWLAYSEYFVFSLEGPVSEAVILKGAHKEISPYDDEEDVLEPVTLKRSWVDVPEVVKETNKYPFFGKIYDSGHTYNIEGELEIEGNGVPGDKVSGYYRYLSQSSSSKIFLSGEFYPGSGTDVYLGLESRNGTELFIFKYFGNWYDKTLAGMWEKINDGQIVNSMSVSITIEEGLGDMPDLEEYQ